MKILIFTIIFSLVVFILSVITNPDRNNSNIKSQDKDFTQGIMFVFWICILIILMGIFKFKI